MRLSKFLEKWENCLRENTFLKIAIFLLALALIVNGQLKRPVRVIVVPPEVKKSFWVEKNKVSPEYLEQLAIFLVTFNANYSPSSIDYNIKTLRQYITPKAYAKIEQDLLVQKVKIQQNHIAQSFFPKKTVTYPGKTQTVDVLGTVYRFVRNKEIFKGKAGYRITLSYETSTGDIKVTELRPLTNLEITKAESKKFFIDPSVQREIEVKYEGS